MDEFSVLSCHPSAAVPFFGVCHARRLVGTIRLLSAVSHRLPPYRRPKPPTHNSSRDQPTTHFVAHHSPPSPYLHESLPPAIIPGGETNGLMQRVEPTPPNDNATEFGEIVYVARADRASKMIFLLGGGFSLGTAGVIWPEFSQRFGSLASWALTLWYNPLFAAPGLIVIVAAAAGIWCLLWFLFYVRVRVEVCQHGICITPGRSRARWDEVHEIYYASRRLRNTPERQSLQLRTSGGKRVNLPHRFQDMDQLISIVRERVEPLLLDKATRTLELERRVSFGPLVTITHDGLMLGRRRTTLPFDQIKSCGVIGPQFRVLDQSKTLIFARLVELIPNATVIGRLVDKLRQEQ